jgi:hypothetical protein
MNTDKFQYDERRYQEVYNQAWGKKQKDHNKLDEYQIEKIFELRDDGHTLKEIAEIFNVAATTISTLIKKKDSL